MGSQSEKYQSKKAKWITCLTLEDKICIDPNEFGLQEYLQAESVPSRPLWMAWRREHSPSRRLPRAVRMQTSAVPTGTGLQAECGSFCMTLQASISSFCCSIPGRHQLSDHKQQVSILGAPVYLRWWPGIGVCPRGPVGDQSTLQAAGGGWAGVPRGSALAPTLCVPVGEDICVLHPFPVLENTFFCR